MNKMSALPELLQFLHANLDLLSPYYPTMKSKTSFNALPKYEGAAMYLSKKLLEDAYLSMDDFNDLSSIEAVIDKATFTSIYHCYSNKTLQGFLEEINTISGEYKHKLLLEDTKFKIDHLNFMSMALNLIRTVMDENLVNASTYTEDNDQETLLYWLWLVFCICHQSFLRRSNNLALTAELISHMFLMVERKLKGNSNESHHNYGYYYGCIRDRLSKSKGKVIITNDNSLPNDVIDCITRKIEDYYPKNHITYSNDHEVFFLIDSMEQEARKGIMKDDIDVIDIYKSYHINRFDNQQQNRQSHSRLISFGPIKVNLKDFIEDLKAYTYLDIDFFFIKHNASPHCFPPIQFKPLYTSFSSNFLTKFQFFHMNLKFNYQTIKSLFIKLLHILIGKYSHYQSWITSREFYCNFLIVIFYIYFTLNFIDNHKTLISLTHNYIRSLNSYDDFSFIDVYRLTSSLTKIPELPINITIILKKFTHDLLAFTLFEESSFVYDFISPSPMEERPEERRLLKGIINDFYQYCFDLIYTLGAKFSYSFKEREMIFEDLLRIATCSETIKSLIRNNYIDIVVIIVFACFQCTTEDEAKGRFNKVFIRYTEQKKKAFVPEVFDAFYMNDEQMKVRMFSVVYAIVSKDKEKERNDSKGKIAEIMKTDYDCKTFRIKAIQEYNTIYDSSVALKGNDGNSNSQNLFLSKKRIRPLTPTINEKMLLSSPFQVRSHNNANIINGNGGGAFKTLFPDPI